MCTLTPFPDLNDTGFVENINMASEGENGLMQHGWPRDDPDTYYNGMPAWRHGDYKDVAYTYVQELYKTWVGIINEEEN